MERELALANDVVIELVPPRQRCKFRSRKFRDGMHVKAIDCQAEERANPDEGSDQRECHRWSLQIVRRSSIPSGFGRGAFACRSGGSTRRGRQMLLLKEANSASQGMGRANSV
jgi:hypothetical protein